MMTAWLPVGMEEDSMAKTPMDFRSLMATAYSFEDSPLPCNG